MITTVVVCSKLRGMIRSFMPSAWRTKRIKFLVDRIVEFGPWWCHILSFTNNTALCHSLDIKPIVPNFNLWLKVLPPWGSFLCYSSATKWNHVTSQPHRLTSWQPAKETPRQWCPGSVPPNGVSTMGRDLGTNPHLQRQRSPVNSDHPEFTSFIHWISIWTESRKI